MILLVFFPHIPEESWHLAGSRLFLATDEGSSIWSARAPGNATLGGSGLSGCWFGCRAWGSVGR